MDNVGSATSAHDLSAWLTMVIADILGPSGPLESGAGLFDLGITSFDIIKLRARIRDGLGIEIPLRALFANATVHDLAREISGLVKRDEGSANLTSQDGSIIQLTPSGTKSPRTALLTPTGGGLIYPYVHLANSLRDRNFNVIGLEEPGMWSGGPHVESVGGMVQSYLRFFETPELEVDAIIGYSFGALVAYELALEFSSRAAVSQQPSLFLIEPTPVSLNPPRRSDNDSVSYWLDRYAGRTGITRAKLRELGDDKVIADHMLRTLSDQGMLHRYYQQDSSRARDMMLGYKATVLAANHYDPPASQLSGALFLVSDENCKSSVQWHTSTGRAERWAGILRGGSRTVFIDGNHKSCMSPPVVDSVAEQISQLTKAASCLIP